MFLSFEVIGEGEKTVKGLNLGMFREVPLRRECTFQTHCLPQLSWDSNHQNTDFEEENKKIEEKPIPSGWSFHNDELANEVINSFKISYWIKKLKYCELYSSYMKELDRCLLRLVNNSKNMYYITNYEL